MSATKVYPIYTPETASRFVQRPEYLTEVEIEGQRITTGYLLNGKPVDLLGISQSKELIDSQIISLTDMLDDYADVDDVLLYDKETGAILEVKSLINIREEDPLDGGFRKINLSKKLTGFVAVGASLGCAQMNFELRGYIDRETASCKIFIGNPSVIAYNSESIDPASLDGVEPAAAAVIEQIQRSEVIGYKLNVARVNESAEEDAPAVRMNTYQTKIIYQNQDGYTVTEEIPGVLYQTSVNGLYARSLSFHSSNAVHGLRNEELLAILVARTEVLDAMVPSEHNKKAIRLMKEALEEFNARTADRISRSVLGKQEL